MSSRFLHSVFLSFGGKEENLLLTPLCKRIARIHLSHFLTDMNN